MYPLILVGLLILFFLPRYWLLLVLVTATTALSGLALHDAWTGVQSLRTTAGQPLLPDALFWQSRSLSEALIRQSVFTVIGGALVAIRKLSIAGRSAATGGDAAQTTSVELTSPQIPEHDSAPPPPRTEPGDVLSNSSADASSSSARLNWSQGLRRVFLALSVIWWCAALTLTLPPAIEEFPERSSVVRSQFERCERRLESDLEYLAWRSTEPPLTQSLDARTLWDQWASRNPCRAEISSPSVQQEIDISHRADVGTWTKNFLLLLAVIVMLPFAIAAALIAGWRVYRWIGDGFRPRV